MTQLTDIQTQILQTLAATPDGSIERPDDNRAAVVSLIRRGLILSLPKIGEPSRLILTDSGRSAVTPASEPYNEVVAPPPPPEPQAPAAESAPAVAPASGSTGKIGALLDLLRRREGATLEAMMAATGWQAHSVRGALSGSVKKKLGLDVMSDKVDGVRIYRVASGA